MSLSQALVQAKQAFDRATARTWCVSPAAPILFFGDLRAYQASPLRLLTVGLNPSLHEFPADQPFRRFPLIEPSRDPELSRYFDAMSAYFRTDPYRGWFKHWYKQSKRSTAQPRERGASPRPLRLFFGDLHAYQGLHEFPADQPFRRFPLIEPSRDPEIPLLRRDVRWFNAFEPLLNGMGASYYEGSASTALHTDICSPVATNPTWSRLDVADQAALETDGGPLWHMLLQTLQPQIVALSVAKAHLQRIEFSPLTEWRIIHAFKRTGNGALRSRPYQVRTRWYEVGAARTLFVFGEAAQKPFGLLPDTQKQKAGALLQEAYKSDR